VNLVYAAMATTRSTMARQTNAGTLPNQARGRRWHALALSGPVRWAIRRTTEEVALGPEEHKRRFDNLYGTFDDAKVVLIPRGPSPAARWRVLALRCHPLTLPEPVRADLGFASSGALNSQEQHWSWYRSR